MLHSKVEPHFAVSDFIRALEVRADPSRMIILGSSQSLAERTPPSPMIGIESWLLQALTKEFEFIQLRATDAGYKYISFRDISYLHCMSKTTTRNGGVVLAAVNAKPRCIVRRSEAVVASW